jgi:class 3 adenylate cyclase
MTAEIPRPYTASVVNEPVRGGFPDPSFSCLPGIERARAELRGHVPGSPLSHLVGYRLTQVTSGGATFSMPASPWLQHADGTLEVRIVAAEALTAAALTAAPPGTELTTATLSVNYLRAPSVEDGTYVARARVVHSVRTFTLAEAILEDALGRAVLHATGSLLMSPVETAIRARVPDQVIEEPAYPTPDPYQRPDPGHFPWTLLDELGGLSLLRKHASGELVAPLYDLLGVRWVEVDQGFVTLTFDASEWLCSQTRDVAPGVLLCVAQLGTSGAAWTVCPSERRVGVLEQTVSFLRAMPAKGGEVLVRGRLVYAGERLLVSSVEVSDPEGNQVALGHQTSVLAERRRDSRKPASHRVLATVLFTDIVGSTLHAEQVGDARWRELLDEHHAVVRKQLELFKGREVKTTGDGFLATFDSPGRAVQCARAIRDGVRRLGLQVRVGLHTGECEASGADLAGIAVHIASRIQGLAAPGEILVSGTVRDLVTGSGLQFADRGRHQLKGIEGDWQLFALDA